jgi:glycosyltransferase involved in cell wall biosynthesis
MRGKINTGWKSLSAIRRRLRFLEEQNVDLVHLNNSPCVGFDDWLPAARLANVPITCHSRGPYFGPQSGIGRWLTRRFDAYVAISQFIAANLAENGAPKARISQIYDGIDLANWKPISQEDVQRVRVEYQVPQDALLVVLVGLIRSWKGQALALKALQRLTIEDRKALRLWIVGGVSESETSFANELRQYVAEMGLEETVTFLGHRFDVSRLMAASDVVLHASTVPEPFGLVVLEGLALGKTVVASRLGGPGEVVRAGEGILFDPSNPGELAGILTELVRAPASSRAFHQNAVARAQLFDVRHTVDSVARVWSSTLAKNSRRRRARQSSRS